MHVVTGVQLLGHGLSLQTVAHELGYESASAFAVMFKKQTGKPPGRFLAERQPRAASASVG
ncbi:Helix-turn-helix domain protein [compost metagenome]